MGYAIARRGAAGRTRYTAMYRDVKGKLRSAGTFSTQKQADRAWQRAEASLAAGRIGDPRRGRQRLEDFATQEWLPNHMMERSTRQNYTYLLKRYLLPEFGPMRMIEILPSDVRAWVVKVQDEGLNPPTIRQCKVILDAIFTTALNDQITYLHAGKGVRTPPVVRKTRRIISVEQFDQIYAALDDGMMRLLVETDIESGLRWGELTELRVSDLDLVTGMLVVARAVVELNPKFHPEGKRFLVKDYPKDKEWRQMKLGPDLIAKLAAHIADRNLGANDLLFELDQRPGPRRRTLPEELPDPSTLGRTEPDERGRSYWHGTLSAYGAGRCRCGHCRDAVAAYRAARRVAGHDSPRAPRVVDTDGHIGGTWFRARVWSKALRRADLGFAVSPHALRHAHASWLLAGGADLQVVRERLGHGSITTTEKYLHALPGADDAALSALDRIRGRRSA
jgi:integrase